METSSPTGPMPDFSLKTASRFPSKIIRIGLLWFGELRETINSFWNLDRTPSLDCYFIYFWDICRINILWGFGASAYWNCQLMKMKIMETKNYFSFLHFDVKLGEVSQSSYMWDIFFKPLFFSTFPPEDSQTYPNWRSLHLRDEERPLPLFCFPAAPNRWYDRNFTIVTTLREHLL